MQYNPPVMVDIFSRWKTGLARSSKPRLAAGQYLWRDGHYNQYLGPARSLLIQADLGLATTEAVIESLKEDVRSKV